MGERSFSGGGRGRSESSTERTWPSRWPLFIWETAVEAEEARSYSMAAFPRFWLARVGERANEGGRGQVSTRLRFWPSSRSSSELIYVAIDNAIPSSSSIEKLSNRS
jgi:hypothetical protein